MLTRNLGKRLFNGHQQLLALDP